MQAEEVGRRLSGLVPDFAELPYVASPLARTRETMDILRRSAGLAQDGYALEPGLIELSFGEWEGRTWREVRRAEQKLAAERERDKWNFVPPKGESYAMLAARIAPVIDTLPARSVVVSHGGVARAFLRLLSGLTEAKAPLVDIWQGRVLVFEDGRHSWH